MAISEHVAQLRKHVGHELLLLPSVSVLLRNRTGGLLLVRPAGPFHGWAILGGGMDPGETPLEAAAREVREEIGVEVGSLRLVDVVGGPDYEVTYPNGDRVAYVTAVYEGSIVAGVPLPDGHELTDLGWFGPDALSDLELNPFARALLTATGDVSRPAVP